MPFLQSDHCRLSFSCGLQFLHHALLFEQLVCRQRRPWSGNAKLAVCSYNNRSATGDDCTRDVADKAAIVRVHARRAYADHVVGRAEGIAGIRSQGRVTVAGTKRERVCTNGRVCTSGVIGEKRVKTDTCVEAAGSGGKDGGNPNGRVDFAFGIVK